MQNDDDKIMAHNDRVAAQVDLRFVEAAFYERDESYQVTSLTQRPLPGNNPDNLPNVEFYAPQDVTVLAFPTLYCLMHAEDHPCAYTHKVDNSMGACSQAYEIVPKKDAYQPSERVQVTAKRSIGGHMSVDA